VVEEKEDDYIDDITSNFEEDEEKNKIYKSFIKNILGEKIKSHLEKVTLTSDEKLVDNFISSNVITEINIFEKTYYTDNFIILNNKKKISSTDKKKNVDNFKDYITLKWKYASNADIDRIKKKEITQLPIYGNKCKLNISLETYNVFLHKLVELLLTNKFMMQQILTNNFMLYDEDNPYIINEQEHFFTMNEVNSLLQKNFEYIKKSNFIENFTFFDINTSEEEPTINIINENIEYYDYKLQNKIVKNVKYKFSEEYYYLQANPVLLEPTQLYKLQKKLKIINTTETMGVINKKVPLLKKVKYKIISTHILR